MLLQMPLTQRTAREVLPTARSPTITILKQVPFSVKVEYEDVINPYINFSQPSEPINHERSHCFPLDKTNCFLYFCKRLSLINHIMFRHLSPKAIPKEKPLGNQIKPTALGQSPCANSKTDSKAHQQKGTNTYGKDIKNLNNFFCQKGTNHIAHSKKPTLPIPPLVVHPNNSSENLRPVVQKNINAFDDYYEKNPKPYPQMKDKKNEVSLSGDSYQSEGYVPVKKVYKTNAKSIADKNTPKTKNLVAIPHQNNQAQRVGFKSPNLKPVNRSESDDDLSLKRILSFGGRKAGPHFDIDTSNKLTKKNMIDTSTGAKSPTSPQHQTKATRFPDLNLSDKKDRRGLNKQTFIPIPNKPSKKIPNVLSAGNIKSPFQHKYALDSSNDLSGELRLKHVAKGKAEHLLIQQNKEKQLQPKEQKNKKSLSFNKGEMFMNLKKRQEYHTKLCKQMNTLGIRIELKLLSNSQIVEMMLITKLCQTKNTAVFQAYHIKTGSLYCLKRIYLSEIRKGDLSSAINQHKVYQYCKHPHLVRGFGSAVDGCYLYLIMEYMEQGTLGHQLRQEVIKNMSEQGTVQARINQSITTQISKVNKIRRILYEITSAVNYLHQRSIIHRDIKPENIFISHDTYKLGDFGSASYDGSLQYVGTLDYAAPEILSQMPYDARVDIWSLGCVAYELDVGRPPFFHINQEQTKRLAIKGEYDRTLIDDIELRNLIQKMLVPVYNFRISASEMLKHQFFSNLKQQGGLY